MKEEIVSMGRSIEIEGGYKDDIIRIKAKLKEYHDSFNEKKAQGIADENERPWMKINDGVRMAITVETPEEAFEISRKIMHSLLHDKTVIKLDNKLTKPHLRNITIHGFNFHRGIQTKPKSYLQLVGAEVQIRVVPDLDEDEENRKNKIKPEKAILDHSLYEFSRNIEGIKENT